MTTTEAPPLTPAARRRALCELAAHYIVEQDRTDRPYTDALTGLLRGLATSDLPTDLAVDVFDRFARCREMARRADVSYDQVHAAGARAEVLLAQLIGEVA